MASDEIPSNYLMNDGEVISFFLDFSGDRTATISLKVRRCVKKEKFEMREVLLLFTGVSQIDISEDFRTNGGYSDFTFHKSEDGYYVSFDPYDNAGVPNENDNFVIRSKNFLF